MVDPGIEGGNRTKVIADLHIVRRVKVAHYPAHTREILSEGPIRPRCPQERLPGVAMRVDKAGDRNSARAVDDLGVADCQIDADRLIFEPSMRMSPRGITPRRGSIVMICALRMTLRDMSRLLLSHYVTTRRPARAGTAVDRSPDAMMARGKRQRNQKITEMEILVASAELLCRKGRLR